jgi:hypothetical protein
MQSRRKLWEFRRIGDGGRDRFAAGEFALVGAGPVNDLKINWTFSSSPPCEPDKIADDGR